MWALQAPTCRAVGNVLIRPAVLGPALLPVVVTHALIQPGLGSGAAVAQGAGAAANGGVAVVEVLRALEAVPPHRPVQPAVAVFAAGPRPRRQPQHQSQQQRQEPRAARPRPPRRTAPLPHGPARGRPRRRPTPTGRARFSGVVVRSVEAQEGRRGLEGGRVRRTDASDCVPTLCSGDTTAGRHVEVDAGRASAPAG